MMWQTFNVHVEENADVTEKRNTKFRQSFLSIELTYIICIVYNRVCKLAFLDDLFTSCWINCSIFCSHIIVVQLLGWCLPVLSSLTWKVRLDLLRGKEFVDGKSSVSAVISCVSEITSNLCWISFDPTLQTNVELLVKVAPLVFIETGIFFLSVSKPIPDTEWGYFERPL